MGGKGQFVIRVVLLSLIAEGGLAHPLRLSVSQIEYSSDTARITVSLRLFLTDVNEALVFDPDNDELRLGREDEMPNAEALLIAYLNEFFYLKINENEVPIVVKSKDIGGTGQDTVLELLLEHSVTPPLRSLEIKNAVFTDLFFDQTNVVYIHRDDTSRSLMLNKKTPMSSLVF
tara:strand:- start:683 stop:1204 length:522 start_codon:yes stop_codon:yes gene_type:complete